MATANKNLSNYDKNTIPNAKNFRFGIVVSEWNEHITEGLYNGTIEALLDCGMLPENCIRWNVPGSFELIYGAKKMIETQNVNCVITIGSVIKGETQHFDFVCDGVTQPSFRAIFIFSVSLGFTSRFTSLPLARQVRSTVIAPP